jgi:hypothetical protein
MRDGVLPLRPLTIGEILDAAVALVRQHAVPLTGLAAPGHRHAPAAWPELVATTHPMGPPFLIPPAPPPAALPVGPACPAALRPGGRS